MRCCILFSKVRTLRIILATFMPTLAFDHLYSLCDRSSFLWPSIWTGYLPTVQSSSLMPLSYEPQASRSFVHCFPVTKSCIMSRAGNLLRSRSVEKSGLGAGNGAAIADAILIERIWLLVDECSSPSSSLQRCSPLWLLARVHAR
jgi:hypothetical protein